MSAYNDLTATQRWAVDCFSTLPGLNATCTSGGPFSDPEDEWVLAIKPDLADGAPTADAWRSLSWLVWFFTDNQRAHKINHGHRVMDMFPSSGGDGAPDLATSLCVALRASEAVVPLAGLARNLVLLWPGSSERERHPGLAFPAEP